MTLKQASERTGKAYSTLHGHMKAGILHANKIPVKNRMRIDVSEQDLEMYLRHEELRDMMTHTIMGMIMRYVDERLTESVIDTMSDEVNNTFQLKIESGIAYLLRKLRA